jgi:hypothetical protein
MQWTEKKLLFEWGVCLFIHPRVHTEDMKRCEAERASINDACSSYLFRSPAEATNFSSGLCVQISSEAFPVFYTMGTGRPFSGGKAWLGRDANDPPSSSAEVKNEYELYLLSPLSPAWR